MTITILAEDIEENFDDLKHMIGKSYDLNDFSDKSIPEDPESCLEELVILKKAARILLDWYNTDYSDH